MKRLAMMGVAAVLVTGCSIYDFESLALVNPDETIVIGDSVEMIVIDGDGVKPVYSSVAWESSDRTIAYIDEYGVVRGSGPGVVSITATTADYRLSVPLKVWAPARFNSVVTGASHSCGITSKGLALCWGVARYGELGRNPPIDRCESPLGIFPCAKSAAPVETGLRFEAIASGYYHVCGIAADGSMHCWGLNDAGQLGDGTSTTRAQPAPVEGGHTFRSLSAGGRATCGLTPDERLLCWGQTRSQTFGDINLPTPTEIAPTYRFRQVSLAPDAAHVCAISTDGATYCWGSNASGQLGVDDVAAACLERDPPYACSSEPVEVSVAPLERVAAGAEYTCGLTADGTVHCWGRNELGQLGDGSGADGWQPRPVAGGHTFSTLAVGGGRACGTEEGTLWCWGTDRLDFGNGGRQVTALGPTAAAGDRVIADAAVGAGHICAMTPDGVAWCWGGSPMGDGEYAITPAPEPVRVVLYDPL